MSKVKTHKAGCVKPVVPQNFSGVFVHCALCNNLIDLDNAADFGAYFICSTCKAQTQTKPQKKHQNIFGSKTDND